MKRYACVPVATFLSSGIDSSVITAISKEIKTGYSRYYYVDR
jgi:asparagine synthetase B (glutamine-hydrolysing)